MKGLAPILELLSVSVQSGPVPETQPGSLQKLHLLSAGQQKGTARDTNGASM